jgi:hypothetical protein
MEIKDKTFYGDNLFLTLPKFTFSVIYKYCIFKGIDFSKQYIISNVFICCRFEECIFTESTLYIFNDCTFINCEFNGTFKANLFECDFDTCIPYVPMTCPVEGDIIGWKVCHGQNNRTPYLVKLRIPDGVKRTSGLGSRKCRCERALVLDILHIDGRPAKETVVVSYYDKMFMYTKGDWVRSAYYDNDRRFICSGGIHFFMERQEAINYYESELV